VERNNWGKLHKMGNAISIPKIDRILATLDAVAASNCPPSEFYAAWFGQLTPLVNASFGCTLVPIAQDQWVIQCRCGNGTSNQSIEQQFYEHVLPAWGSDDTFLSDGKSGPTRDHDGVWRGWLLSKSASNASRILLFWDRGSLIDSTAESVLDGFLEIAQSYYHESTTTRMKSLLHEWHRAITPLRRAPSGQVRDAIWTTALQSVTQSERAVLLHRQSDVDYRCTAISNSLETAKGGVHLRYEKLALEHHLARDAAEKNTTLHRFQTDHHLAAIQIAELPDSKDAVILEWSNRPAFENSIDYFSWLLPVIETSRFETKRVSRPLWIQKNWMLCFLLAVLLGIAFAAGTSTELYVEAEGTLQPQRHQVLFVPMDGFIQRWYVQDGQLVKVGDKLVDIQSPTLDSHLQQLQHELLMCDEKKNGLNLLLAQLSTETSNETSATAGRLAGELQELEQTKVNLNARNNLALDEKKRLQLVSQIDGTVIASSLELDRSVVPVSRGDAIVRVADTHGPWLVEANIADEDIGVLPPEQELKKQEISMVRTTGTTDATIYGTLQRVASTIRPANSRPVLVATFSTTIQPTNLRPGSKVHVYIPCGQARRWYIWTRPLIQSLKRRFWAL
jgi:multidrug efflux pump subunit AcrA (membrane-fusion protein)